MKLCTGDTELKETNASFYASTPEKGQVNYVARKDYKRSKKGSANFDNDSDKCKKWVSKNSSPTGVVGSPKKCNNQNHLANKCKF